jgi:hypothetical protein
MYSNVIKCYFRHIMIMVLFNCQQHNSNCTSFIHLTSEVFSFSMMAEVHVQDSGSGVLPEYCNEGAERCYLYVINSYFHESID